MAHRVRVPKTKFPRKAGKVKFCMELGINNYGLHFVCQKVFSPIRNFALFRRNIKVQQEV